MDFCVSCVHANKTIIFLNLFLIIPSFRSLERSVLTGTSKFEWELKIVCMLGSMRPTSDVKVLRPLKDILDRKIILHKLYGSSKMTNGEYCHSGNSDVLKKLPKYYLKSWRSNSTS